MAIGRPAQIGLPFSTVPWLLGVAGLGWTACRGSMAPKAPSEASDSTAPRVPVIRFSQNPIIRPEMPGLAGPDGASVNGPSLIAVPPWVSDPLGRYYLYFAQPRGSSIRLAYADRLEGPWTVHADDPLRLQQTGFDDYVGSPDLHVDDDGRRIIMYYHGHRTGMPRSWQATRVAVSKDGLHFTDRPQDLGVAYFRVFRWRGEHFALALGGELYRARSREDPWKETWETGVYPFQYPGAPRGPVFRHGAVQIDRDTLTVYFSRVGDLPERILRSTIPLNDDWRSWRASEPVTVLEPSEPYEGGNLPDHSRGGAAPGRARQLRDPAVFQEGGRTYLLYTVAGESGIAIAELKD